MIAVVPLHVAALRVSADDATGVTPRFKGRTAWFEKAPYGQPVTANTGDAVFQDLADQTGTSESLGPGIHLHWELPDHLRRGEQLPSGGRVSFPPAPNRWLVIRYLRVRDGAEGALGPVRTMAWMVESDRLSLARQTDPGQMPDARPAVPVPVPATADRGGQAFQFLGRVVPLDSWREGGDKDASYLAEPLTAIGFVGPVFSAYYPECSSVFGFWDRFLDAPDVNRAIAANQPVHFVASYQVIGWVRDAAADPLAGLAASAMEAFRTRETHCKAGKVPLDTSFPREFVHLAERRLRWTFRAEELPKVAAGDAVPITAPSRTLFSGLLQSVQWDFAGDGSDIGFVANVGGRDTAVWNDSVNVTVGRTTQEALAATIRADLDGDNAHPDVQRNDEFLIHALLLGLLYGLEQKTNKIAELEDALHGQSFARVDGGHLWAVQNRAAQQQEPDPDAEIDLPLDVALALAELNTAQKEYDQARAALSVTRSQLFMDWFRYAKAEAVKDPGATKLATFLARGGISGSGALAAVYRQGHRSGVLEMKVSDSGEISLSGSPEGSLAARLAALHLHAKTAIPAGADWVLRQVPAPPFWRPGEPVLLLSKGKMIEPARRNGPAETIAVRVDGQVIDCIVGKSSDAAFSLDAASVAALLPASLDDRLPVPDTIRLLATEALMLMPSLVAAGAHADAVATAQAGLFAAVRMDGAMTASNPTQTVEAITFTFTNETGNGWAPDPVGWSSQIALPEFGARRLDPFLPISLVWEVAVTPLKLAAPGNYTATHLTDYFQLDDDGIDWTARLQDGAAVPMLGDATISYGGSVLLSRRAAVSLGQQIDTYLADHPHDPNHPETDPGPELLKIKADYAGARMLSQGLSGLPAQLTVRKFIARTPVADLVYRSGVTTEIGAQARAGNWYDGPFNTFKPVPDGPNAAYFGPLFAGMMKVTRLEIIDVFGQRLSLTSPDGPMRSNPAMSLQPPPGLPSEHGDIFFPPRLLNPTRLWFRWLSAATPANRADGFVEMNTHPATSPVCGWLLPNHLDHSIAFYDAGGTPVGSFGLEAGGTKYRTRPGNTQNKADDLDKDLGPVNPHLARMMRYVASAAEGFLADLMATILATDATILPGGAREDASLAVFIGRPLALARAVIGLETQGGLLPLSQADPGPDGPFQKAIDGQMTDYTDREAIASARLGDVLFPLRLGDVANLDDGLIGYLPETPAGDFAGCYSGQAPAGGSHGVVRPDLSTLALRLNEAPRVVSLLLDPRAAVHATSGLLPVEKLRIPPDQYAATLRGLAVTFAAHPLLHGQLGRVVPLPQEAGYDWSWISPLGDADSGLRANAADDTAVTSYSPQILEEGWLRLTPSPPERDPEGA